MPYQHSFLKTPYKKIVDCKMIGKIQYGSAEKAINLGLEEKLTSAENDTKKILLIGINFQNDFIVNKGAFFIPAATHDVRRFTKFIYKYTPKITKILLIRDTCPIPADKKKWDQSCPDTTFGQCIETQLRQMVYYYGAARHSIPLLIDRKFNDFSEISKSLASESNLQGNSFASIDEEIVKTLLVTDSSGKPRPRYDQIIIGGETGSHRVPQFVRQILNLFHFCPEYFSQIVLLEDCMSPLPGHQQLMQDALVEFRNKKLRVEKRRVLISSSIR